MFPQPLCSLAQKVLVLRDKNPSKLRRPLQ